jgi:glycosyltransferase involved in cell wall biosynthesis
MKTSSPRLLVYTTLFPHPGQPNAGVFIRERMFRVGQHLPLVVVAPVPWFPFQSLLRRWKPHFRPDAPRFGEQSGFKVYHPRFFSIPGLLKSLDGLFMALGSYLTLRKLSKEFQFNIIDAHFAYPDGYAAVLLGRWLKIPVAITLRGTEVPLSQMPARAKRMVQALRSCQRIFSVSESLKALAVHLGIPREKIRVIGNGVDGRIFFAVDKFAARKSLDIPEDAKVLISVGGLVPRKGFQRVIEIMPELLARYPNLVYLVVGGPSPEGDMGKELLQQVERLNLQNHVKFLGPMPSASLKSPLSAADVFVLSTSNEGWANVFLEAMACGLPVIATDVGGNREVVSNEELGHIVPFGDPGALRASLASALEKNWDRAYIQNHAAENSWDRRVAVLLEEFAALV